MASFEQGTERTGMTKQVWETFYDGALAAGGNLAGAIEILTGDCQALEDEIKTAAAEARMQISVDLEAARHALAIAQQTLQAEAFMASHCAEELQLTADRLLRAGADTASIIAALSAVAIGIAKRDPSDAPVYLDKAADDLFAAALRLRAIRKL